MTPAERPFVVLMFVCIIAAIVCWGVWLVWLRASTRWCVASVVLGLLAWGFLATAMVVRVLDGPA